MPQKRHCREQLHPEGPVSSLEPLANEGMCDIKSLRDAWNQAQTQGWSFGQAKDLQALRSEAGWAKWEALEARKGKGTETVLRPITQEAAPYPRSISAVYGMDEQPLHVDGAHFPSPPDAVLLFCETPNETPTNVLPIGRLTGSGGMVENLRHGLFIVGSGPAAFLAPALEKGRLRYDPNIMEPADSRAREAAEYIGSMQDKAIPLPWTAPNSYLLIANRLVLHGRAKVDKSDATRVVTRISYRAGGTR